MAFSGAEVVKVSHQAYSIIETSVPGIYHKEGKLEMKSEKEAEINQVLSSGKGEENGFYLI